MMLADATIGRLQEMVARGDISIRGLVEWYLDRIDLLDRHGPGLRSIIEINPEARQSAAALDLERATGTAGGPLHGVPVLLKDNIDTVDAMSTTAGSLALEGARRQRDAFVVTRLRQAGAILLGKTNMSEWANFRSTHSCSGWSARGGQGRNPYALDRTPCGSSSGSAQAVAAGLAVVSLGTETNGSIVCPAAANSVVGIKPTVGLTSRSGVIPIAHSQDTVGPFARTVADAAAVLTVIAGVDPSDPTTLERAHPEEDYSLSLDLNAMEGARIGIPRDVYYSYSEKADAVMDDAIRTMRELGAVIVDPANIPTAQQIRNSDAPLTVLLYEFKSDLNDYLATLDNSHVHALQDIIDFNLKHADKEMPYFGQELFLKAQEKGPLSDEAYVDALTAIRRLSREEGIDAVMNDLELDALVTPTNGPPWKIDHIVGDTVKGGSSTPAALAGYPAISVPAGYVFGLPIGMTFTGRAFSEATLIGLAHAFEQAANVRRPPEFLPLT